LRSKTVQPQIAATDCLGLEAIKLEVGVYLVEQEESSASVGNGVKHTKKGHPKHTCGKSVLIVDDNPTVRRTVCKAFRSGGFAICGEAEDGRKAIALAKQALPDLIILDLSMPVMNGLQAAPELRKVAPNTVIILFTMFDNSLLADQLPKIGIDLVVSKTEALSSVLYKAHSLVGA
jgi:CheY-like chemotaxis protein